MSLRFMALFRSWMVRTRVFDCPNEHTEAERAAFERRLLHYRARY